MAASVMKLSFCYPAPCESKDLDASSTHLLKLLNKQIARECQRQNLPRCFAVKCAPLTRTMGTLLPCGWTVHFKLPLSFTRWIEQAYTKQTIILKYLKKLGIPLLPAKRQITEDFIPEKKVFRKDRYNLELSLDSCVAVIKIGVGCNCVVQRYLNHFQLTGIVKLH